MNILGFYFGLTEYTNMEYSVFTKFFYFSGTHILKHIVFMMTLHRRIHNIKILNLLVQEIRYWKYLHEYGSIFNIENSTKGTYFVKWK